MNSSYNRNLIARIFDWLEYHWATPAYGGWVLIGISLSFFGAATNTMAGWLYVLSGMLLSLLGLNVIIAIATVKQIKVSRSPIASVYAGDELTLTIIVKNPTKKSKLLIEIIDQIPASLGIVKDFILEEINQKGKKQLHRHRFPEGQKEKNKFPIEVIAPKSQVKLTLYLHTSNRGIYHWQDLILKSAAPFGLFSCSRQRQIESRAIIYPSILPLHSCPLIDNIGDREAQKRYSNKIYRNSTDGITKSLRQYRYGDAMRLIHWRSSARWGELQVRELETITGGEEIIICLDNSSNWEANLFEEAVKATASIYFYGSKQQLPINLWIANMGTVHGSQVILETLAGVNSGEMMTAKIPDTPVVWLSNNSESFSLLPKGSHYFLFAENANAKALSSTSMSGIYYDPNSSLVNQLQKPLANFS